MFFSKKYYLKTTLSKEEIINRIFSITTLLNRQYNGKIFKTNDAKYDFKITRNIAYRNSFLPVIKGKITAEENGVSTMEITIGMILFVRIFTMFWIFIVSIIGIPFFITFLSTKNINGLIPIFMIIFLIILIYFAYIKEHELSKKFLIDLLNAEIIK